MSWKGELDVIGIKSKLVSVVLAILVFSTSVLAAGTDTTLGENSAYTLEETANQADDTITKYEYNSETGEVTPVYYKLILKEQSYGDTSKESSVQVTTMGQTITAYYDNGDQEYVEKPTVDIARDFINSSNTSSSESDGGALFNALSNSINISGNFIRNYAYAVAETGEAEAYGGAIFNEKGSLGTISGDFVGNYAYAKSSDSEYSCAEAGAIHNDGSIDNITANFIGNSAYAENDGGRGALAYGGAIYNEAIYADESTINSIKGDFIGNSAKAESTSGSAEAEGGAIANFESSSSIAAITGDFIGNSAYGKASEDAFAFGGAISTDGAGNINGDFIGNSAVAEGTGFAGAYGGAIDVYGTIDNITGNFIENSAVASGSDTEALGGAICQETEGEGGHITITNSSFYNNYAKSESGEALGGAIYTDGDLNLVSDNYTMVFDGNYTESSGTRDDNAIYADGPDATVNFNLKNNGAVVMNDNINGDEGYKINIQGDSADNTTFYLFNDMYNANLSIGNTTLNTINGDIHVYNVNSFTLTDNINMAVDVDLAEGTMDRITASEYGSHNGTLTVTGMNLISDATKDTVDILFADTGLMDNVAVGMGDLPHSYQTTAYSPIYKYEVDYETRDNGGYFTFNRSGGGSGGGSGSFNPAVLSSPVAAQAGAYTTMNTAYTYAFEHSDYFMMMPNAERLALRNANKYAIADTSDLSYQNNELTNNAVWFRPYTSFENIPLKNGPKVDTISYGSLFGFDTDFKEHKNGWGSFFTGYAGYNGSSQSYTGVDTYQNGGLIGATETFYRNKFYTAITASAGASVGETSNMYGHENFTMLMAGIASKTGYSIEFKEGKYVVLPTFLMSYIFVNTFDYKNSAGVSIKSDPMHAIQINPNIRFIANTENGWQPYATVGMVWNILDKTKVTANEIVLPQMSIKPYVEYGLGLQKRWKDRFAGYAQAVIRNGGRTGIAFTFGFRWSLGRTPQKNVNINDNTLVSSRKIIKNNIESRNKNPLCCKCRL